MEHRKIKTITILFLVIFISTSSFENTFFKFTNGQNNIHWPLSIQSGTLKTDLLSNLPKADASITNKTVIENGSIKPGIHLDTTINVKNLPPLKHYTGIPRSADRELHRNVKTFEEAKEKSLFIKPNNKVIELPLPFNLNNSKISDIIKSASNNLNQTLLNNHALSSINAGSSSKIFHNAKMPSINGLSENGNIVPPDVQIAVGGQGANSEFEFEMVNLDGSIYKHTVLIGNIHLYDVLIRNFNLSYFFQTLNDRISDPKLVFDTLSNRWFATILDITTNTVKIATSASPDPTGSWNIYSLVFGRGPSLNYCSDQPTIGYSNSKFAVGVNTYGNNCNPYSDGREPEYIGAQFAILEKRDLISGASSPVLRTTPPDPNGYSVHPVRSITSSDSLYMVSQESDSRGSFIKLYTWIGPVTPLGGPGPVKAISYSNIYFPASASPPMTPPPGIQPSDTYRIDTSDNSIQDAFYENGKIWITFNTSCVPSGDTTPRSCIGVADITPDATHIEYNIFGTRGLDMYYPAISPIQGDELSIVNGFSNRSTYPSSEYSIYKIINLPRILGISTSLLIPILSQVIKSGSSLDNEVCSNPTPNTTTVDCRFGDYFGSAVDPYDSSTNWVASEYYGGQQKWSTSIDQIPLSSFHSHHLHINNAYHNQRSDTLGHNNNQTSESLVSLPQSSSPSISQQHMATTSNETSSMLSSQPQQQREQSSTTVPNHTSSFNPINTPPIAQDQTITTSQNKSAVIDLQKSTKDKENDDLTATVVTNPTNGDVKIDQANGKMTYTPSLGYVGTDSFTYKVNDGKADSNIATVHLTIQKPLHQAAQQSQEQTQKTQPPIQQHLRKQQPQILQPKITNNPGTSFSSTPTTTTTNQGNHPPVAQDQTTALEQTDTSKSITLSATDVDSNDNLAAAIVNPPTHGTLGNINQVTGQVIYTPSSGYSGTDSFTYKVNDGKADSNIATVHLTIQPKQTTSLYNQTLYNMSSLLQSRHHNNAHSDKTLNEIMTPRIISKDKFNITKTYNNNNQTNVNKSKPIGFFTGYR